MTPQGLVEVKATLAEALALAESRRLRSALARLSEAVARAPRDPQLRYNLGAVHFCSLGDGESARSEFQEVLACPASGDPGEVRVRAAAAENLMLLAVSFEEYERWAEELRRLQPGNPILSGHRAAVVQAQEAGQPWWGVLGGNALMHHNPHDPRAVRRSSQAAATWQLLVNHREHGLRLPPVEARRALVGYVAELIDHACDCGQAMQAQGWDDPSEFTFLLRPAQGPLRRHLEADPEDRDLQRLAGNVVMLLNQGPIGASRNSPRDLDVRQTRELVMGAPLSRSEEPPAAQVPPPPPALGCFLAAVGIGLGALAGRLWLARPGSPWNAVAGGILGLMLMSSLYRAWQRARQGAGGR